MQKRTRYVLAAVLALAVIAFVVVGLLPPQPGVTQANFDRIEDGMTLAEVEAILGSPPEFSSNFRLSDKIHLWPCPSGQMMSVGISKDEGVFHKIWPEADVTFFRRICRWLSPPLKMEAR